MSFSSLAIYLYSSLRQSKNDLSLLLITGFSIYSDSVHSLSFSLQSLPRNKHRQHLVSLHETIRPLSFSTAMLSPLQAIFVNYSKRTESIGASTRQNTPRWVVTPPLSPVMGITYAAIFTDVHTFLVHPNAFIRSALRSERSPCLILDIRLQVCFLKFLRSLYERYQSCMFTVSVV